MMKKAKLPLFERYVGAQQNNGTGAKFQATRLFSAPSYLSLFVAELYFAYYKWLGLVKGFNANEETAWCEWLQQNFNAVIKKPPDLNGDHDAPPDLPPAPSAGQYRLRPLWVGPDAESWQSS